MNTFRDILIEERNEALLAVERTARVLALGRVDDDIAANNIRDIIKLYSRASRMSFTEWRRYQKWRELYPEISDTDEVLVPPYGKNAKVKNAVDDASLAELIAYANDITQLAAIDNGVMSMLDAYADGVPVEDILA